MNFPNLSFARPVASPFCGPAFPLQSPLHQDLLISMSWIAAMLDFAALYGAAMSRNASFGGSATGPSQVGVRSQPLQRFLGGGSPRPRPQGNPVISSGRDSFAGGGRLAATLPGPLRQYASAFERAGQKYGIDPRFLAAISMTETGSGTSKAFRSKNNAMGVSNARGPIAFASVEDSIDRMARSLTRKKGAYAGKTTIGQIAGVYCPVGAGNDVHGTNSHWPRLVSKFYRRLGGDPRANVKMA